MALLDKLREQYGVRPVCSELHIAPSTYYHCQQQRHHPDKDRYAVNCILPRQRITTVSNSDIILINAVHMHSAMTG
ncbi:hypothetical protein O5477_01500 [Escherichia coli]|nr:hypothetical protein [Escherichia coli]